MGQKAKNAGPDGLCNDWAHATFAVRGSLHQLVVDDFNDGVHLTGAN
jgi:hypothetical protein